MICKICNKNFTRVTSHVVKAHGITSIDYKIKFYNNPNVVLVSKEHSSKMRDRANKHYASIPRNKFSTLIRLSWLLKILLLPKYSHLRPTNSETLCFCDNCDKPVNKVLTSSRPGIRHHCSKECWSNARLKATHRINEADSNKLN